MQLEGVDLWYQDKTFVNSLLKSSDRSGQKMASICLIITIIITTFILVLTSAPLDYWWYETYWRWFFPRRTREASLQGPRHTPASRWINFSLSCQRIIDTDQNKENKIRLVTLVPPRRTREASLRRPRHTPASRLLWPPLWRNDGHRPSIKLQSQRQAQRIASSIY